MLGILCLNLIGANPVADFWIDAGLDPSVAGRIGSGIASPEDNLLAQEIQNKSRGIDPESELNITEIEEEAKLERERKGDIRGGIFLGILLSMAILSVVVILLILIKEKA